MFQLKSLQNNLLPQINFLQTKLPKIVFVHAFKNYNHLSGRIHLVHFLPYTTRNEEYSMVWIALALVFLVIDVVLFIAVILLTTAALYWARTKNFTPGNITNTEGTVYC